MNPESSTVIPPRSDLSPEIKNVITGRFEGMKKITPGLLEAICAGDADAFKALYEITQRPLYAFISRAYPRFDAEEITQAVMVDVWEKHDRIDPHRNFGGYIFRMAVSYANRMYERSIVEKSYMDYARSADCFAATPDDLLIEEQTALLYEIALRKMPERRRRIFEMYRSEGLSHEEIADKLHISKQTVNYNIHIAKKELSELLTLLLALISLSR